MRQEWVIIDNIRKPCHEDREYNDNTDLARWLKMARYEPDENKRIEIVEKIIEKYGFCVQGSSKDTKYGTR